MQEHQKIVVVVGPTASGKSSLAIDIAKKFRGEVVSVDSRQIYRGLDIGTEKLTEEEMRDIPHHLIDIVDPEVVYTAADFKRDAEGVIDDLFHRNKLPIIAGGTFFYIDVLLGTLPIAEVKPDSELRKELEEKTTEELFSELQEHDPRRAETIDPHNRRRLIRALEIIDTLGKVPEPNTEKKYNPLFIGIKTDYSELRDIIHARLEDTLKKGLVKETQKLLDRGLNKDRLNEIGLEYRIVLKFLEGLISEKEMLKELQYKLWQYAKRQNTWLKKNEHIKWFERERVQEICEEVERFVEVEESGST